ncbi:MAG TPA: hypothetical protein VNF51_00910 [Candidatus Paceibacterota bacterium]|nr:hypothetical protein [Candidatus Paceibacterota bacterium]
MSTTKTKESPIVSGTVGQKQCRKTKLKRQKVIGGCILIRLILSADGTHYVRES